MEHPVHHGKRHWRNFLLDRFQLRYAGLIVFMSATLTSGLGLLVYRYAREATEIVKVTVLETVEDADVQSHLISSLGESDRRLLLILIGFGLLLTVILSVYGVVVTHRVAGPLYKMSGYFAAMREGRLPSIDTLRKNDQLHEFFDSFRAMCQAMRSHTEEEARVLGEIIQALETSSQAQDVTVQLDQLRGLRQNKQASLG